jgi:redox-sensing transcriptional repressor
MKSRIASPAADLWGSSGLGGDKGAPVGEPLTGQKGAATEGRHATAPGPSSRGPLEAPHSAEEESFASVSAGLGAGVGRGRPDKRVSVQTVERLSVYRRVLEELHYEGTENVYSQQLAEMVGVTPAQLRRDLASFGSFGHIAKGYNVYSLIRTISRILGTDARQNVALIGVGDLGRSLLAYRGFEERGFHISAAFDIDPEKVGQVYSGRRCYALDDLERVIEELHITMAILACRPEGLQRVADRLARAGVRSFLNFVPKRISAPEDSAVEHIDIAAKLEKLSFLSRHAG